MGNPASILRTRHCDGICRGHSQALVNIEDELVTALSISMSNETEETFQDLSTNWARKTILLQGVCGGKAHHSRAWKPYQSGRLHCKDSMSSLRWSGCIGDVPCLREMVRSHAWGPYGKGHLWFICSRSNGRLFVCVARKKINHTTLQSRTKDYIKIVLREKAQPPGDVSAYISSWTHTGEPNDR